MHKKKLTLHRVIKLYNNLLYDETKVGKALYIYILPSPYFSEPEEQTSCVFVEY